MRNSGNGRTHNNRSHNNRNQNNNRGRHKNNNNRNKNNRNNNSSYDSHGPKERVRGRAKQVYDKYIGLATEARRVNDRILAESYFQHAEHYLRQIPEVNTAKNTPNKKYDNQQKQQNTQNVQKNKAVQDNSDDENKSQKKRKTRRGNRRKTNKTHDVASDTSIGKIDATAAETSPAVDKKEKAEVKPKIAKKPKPKPKAKTKTESIAEEDRSAVDMLVTRPVKQKKTDDKKEVSSTE